jgi:hypothetical protein
MRKIISAKRSRNETVLYMVVRDGTKRTMEVWRCLPNTKEGATLLYLWPFELHPNGWITTSDSERSAHRRATTLADALSRMAPSEVLRQLESIRSTGTLR